ncbi:MAG TPA: hypothetical protein QGH10_23640, partial [Armatimonadota bacterium]|nr:hypothetical protein [Armatimonadota bacterium]
AKRVGLEVAVGNAVNHALTTAPTEIAATQPPGKPPGGGIVCPSIPAGREYLLDIWRQTMRAFSDVGGGIDYICVAPYDTGGCGCEQCMPWASNGYLRISKDVIEQEKTVNPECKLILSTWLFDAAEWEGLHQALGTDSYDGWVAYIMAGGIVVSGMDGYPQYPLDHGTPSNIPLVNFRDISMWGMQPWGGYGANPQPERFQKLWRAESRMLAGGILYSEGIYEDINKAINGQLFWTKDGDTEDTVREYIAFEYSPDVVDDVLAAIHILEGSLTTAFGSTERDNITESVCEAHDLITKAEAKLSPRARNSWRWRILSLRATIDNELFNNQGKLEGPVLKRAFDELTEIYHAENTTPGLQPPKLP